MVRQELDLRTGAAFTRFQSLLLKSNFPESILTKFISYGPCQTPTLFFVVKRYLDHVNFTSQNFYFINLKIIKNDFEVQFNWERGKLFDKYIAGVLYEYIMEKPEVKVVSQIKKETIRYKPYPLTTIDFQKLAVQ